MAEAKFLSVRNLPKYQHYSQRNPPWVKWHLACLDDPAFTEVDDATKWLAVGMVMLASRTENKIPSSPSWIRGRLFMKSDPDLKALVEIGFLVDASNSLATCKRTSPNPLASETEIRDRVRSETGSATPRPRVSYLPGFLKLWNLYPHQGSRSSKPESLAVWKRRGLEEQVDRVVLWVEALKGREDWARESGKFVPGLQVWLKKPEFTDDPPPERGTSGLSMLSEKGRRSAAAAQRWLDGGSDDQN